MLYTKAETRLQKHRKKNLTYITKRQRLQTQNKPKQLPFISLKHTIWWVRNRARRIQAGFNFQRCKTTNCKLHDLVKGAKSYWALFSCSVFFSLYFVFPLVCKSLAMSVYEKCTNWRQTNCNKIRANFPSIERRTQHIKYCWLLKLVSKHKYILDNKTPNWMRNRIVSCVSIEHHMAIWLLQAPSNSIAHWI